MEVSGPRELLEEIKDKVRIYLKDKLNLELFIDKTKITYLGSEYNKFLEYYIKVNITSQNLTSYIKTSEKGFYYIRKGTGKPKLMFPKNLIHKV